MAVTPTQLREGARQARVDGSEVERRVAASRSYYAAYHSRQQGQRAQTITISLSALTSFATRWTHIPSEDLYHCSNLDSGVLECNSIAFTESAGEDKGGGVEQSGVAVGIHLADRGFNRVRTHEGAAFTSITRRSVVLWRCRMAVRSGRSLGPIRGRCGRPSTAGGRPGVRRRIVRIRVRGGGRFRGRAWAVRSRRALRQQTTDCHGWPEPSCDDTRTGIPSLISLSVACMWRTPCRRIAPTTYLSLAMGLVQVPSATRCASPLTPESVSRS